MKGKVAPKAASKEADVINYLLLSFEEVDIRSCELFSGTPKRRTVVAMIQLMVSVYVHDGDGPVGENFGDSIQSVYVSRKHKHVRFHPIEKCV
jgi:hypothetical protein